MQCICLIIIVTYNPWHLCMPNFCICFFCIFDLGTIGGWGAPKKSGCLIPVLISSYRYMEKALIYIDQISHFFLFWGVESTTCQHFHTIHQRILLAFRLSIEINSSHFVNGKYTTYCIQCRQFYFVLLNTNCKSPVWCTRHYT